MISLFHSLILSKYLLLFCLFTFESNLMMLAKGIRRQKGAQGCRPPPVSISCKFMNVLNKHFALVAILLGRFVPVSAKEDKHSGVVFIRDSWAKLGAAAMSQCASGQYVQRSVSGSTVEQWLSHSKARSGTALDVFQALDDLSNRCVYIGLGGNDIVNHGVCHP